MFPEPVSILLALTGVALAFYHVGLFAAAIALRRPRKLAPPDTTLPNVTLLKPIKGEEDSLESNLRSFYEQDYPAAIEIVFASERPDDPGIVVARRVAAEYPGRRSIFVVARDDFGLNPKVSTLHGALKVAAYDLVLQSDANVRLRRDHLALLVREMIGTGAALIGSLVVGEGEQSTFAALENLQLSTFTAPGVCAAQELSGIRCVLGKAMLFRKHELEALGGLAVVKDVLAEDYALCRLYDRAHLGVVLSTAPVSNINERTSLRRFLSRHSRWLKMRAVVSASGFAADLGTNPLPFALGAYLASGARPQLGCGLLMLYLYKCAMDSVVLHRLRGHGLGIKQLWATPLRDLLMAGVWCYALLSRRTEWRGRKLRIGPGSLLQGGHELALPQRVLRKVGRLRAAK